MGLFDELKRTTLGKIVNSVEKSLGDLAGHSENSGNSYESSASPVATQASEWSASQNDFASVSQRFDRILATEFSEFQIIRNATPESVGISAPTPCRPYSFALVRDGKTAAVIMLTPHNRDRNSAFLNAKKSAINSNVVFLNYYSHFANEHNYVVSRIRNAL